MTDIFGVWDATVAEALKTVPIAAKMAASYWKELRSNGLDKGTATTVTVAFVAASFAGVKR
jgi:hypothetical protein